MDNENRKTIFLDSHNIMPTPFIPFNTFSLKVHIRRLENGINKIKLSIGSVLSSPFALWSVSHKV